MIDKGVYKDAVAKIAAVKLCRYYNQQYGTDYISVMPTNLYGAGDNFDPACGRDGSPLAGDKSDSPPLAAPVVKDLVDLRPLLAVESFIPETSHVLPAMIRKFHEAKAGGKPEEVLWGKDKPRREFLFVDDLADAVVFLMNTVTAKETGELINIGTGSDLSIKELAELVRSAVGFSGGIIWDETKPDGTPQKLLDVSKIEARGWRAKTGLKDGIAITYKIFSVNLNPVKYKVT